MRRHRGILFSLLAAATALLFVADIAVGSVAIPLRDIAAALTGGETEASTREIVVDIRLMRAIMAVLAGTALSASGLQMQTLFRNPLAGPYVLGVSAGASLGAALFLLGAPLLGLTAMPALQAAGTAGAAWVGAAAILLLVLSLSRRIKDIMTILILGIMLSSAIGAAVEIMQYMSSETALKSFVVWTMGSLGGVTGGQLAIAAAATAAGTVLAIAAVKPMNMLMLGETYARTTGLDIERARHTILFSTTLLAGTITAFCGPIGFVGIAVPHIARMIFATADHRTLLPSSLLVGAAMMLLCDIIAKRLTLPINSVTALMGIPVVIFIVIRSRNMLR